MGALWLFGRLRVSDATYVLVRALMRGDYFHGFEKVRTELFHFSCFSVLVRACVVSRCHALMTSGGRSEDEKRRVRTLYELFALLSSSTTVCDSV